MTPGRGAFYRLAQVRRAAPLKGTGILRCSRPGRLRPTTSMIDVCRVPLEALGEQRAAQARHSDNLQENCTESRAGVLETQPMSNSSLGIAAQPRPAPVGSRTHLPCHCPRSSARAASVARANCFLLRSAFVSILGLGVGVSPAAADCGDCASDGEEAAAWPCDAGKYMRHA